MRPLLLERSRLLDTVAKPPLSAEAGSLKHGRCVHMTSYAGMAPYKDLSNRMHVKNTYITEVERLREPSLEAVESPPSLAMPSSGNDDV